MFHRFVLTLFLLTASGVHAAELEYGLGLDLSRDLADSGLDQGAAKLGLGDECVFVLDPLLLPVYPGCAPRFGWHDEMDRAETSASPA